MQNTWKVLKQAMNISKNRSEITEIRHNDGIIDDVDNIANIFNEYFVSTGKNLAEVIPHQPNTFLII